MTLTPNDDGWTEWSRYVLKELERLSKAYEGIRADVMLIRTELATLKVRAGIWGAIGAAIPIAIVLLIQTLGKP